MISCSTSALIGVSDSSISLTPRTAGRAVGPAHVSGDQGTWLARGIDERSRRECSKATRPLPARPTPQMESGEPAFAALYCRTCDHLFPRLVTRRPAVGCLLEIVETLVLTL